MPLIQGKSPKSFKKNVEVEMSAGKPQKQSLAIAYSIKKKNSPKKMASGGSVKDTAAGESRPMPDQTFQDSQDVSQNRGKKPIMKGDWTDDTYSDQASKSFSKASSSNEQSWTDRGEVSVDDERDSESMPKKSPSMRQDITANDERRSSADDRDDREMSMFAKGGMAMPGASNDADEHYSSIADAILAKKKKAKMMADGGSVDDDMPSQKEQDESGYPPGPERATYMANKKAEAQGYADGGEVDIDENAREYGNKEDDLSWEALKKENYSEQSALDEADHPMDSNMHGHDLPDEDSHDMVDAIRRKMKMKRGM